MVCGKHSGRGGNVALYSCVLMVGDARKGVVCTHPKHSWAGLGLGGGAGRAPPPAQRHAAPAQLSCSQDAVEHSLVVVILPRAPGIQAVTDQAQHNLHQLQAGQASAGARGSRGTGKAAVNSNQSTAGTEEGGSRRDTHAHARPGPGRQNMAQPSGAHLRLGQRQVEALLQALNRRHAALEAGHAAGCTGGGTRGGKGGKGRGRH